MSSNSYLATDDLIDLVFERLYSRDSESYNTDYKSLADAINNRFSEPGILNQMKLEKFMEKLDTIDLSQLEQFLVTQK